MLSVLLRRSTVAACRALRWAGPSQRCWTPALTGVPEDGSTSSGIISSTRLSFTEREPGHVKPPLVSRVRRTKLFQSSQTWDALLLVRNQHFHSSAARLKKRARPELPPPELDLLRYDMKHLWNGPKPALYLGFAGLIPFVVPTLFMAATEVYYPQVAYAQLAYAASIISFLGGARWGFALPESSPAKPDWINLSNSVVPSLLAWVTMLMSDSIVTAGIMVIMGLGISLHYDLALLPTYPSWFKALRAVLTAVAFFSLVGTMIMNGSYPEKSLF
ncbi:transmembrane protein 69-like [Cololabis saira]|uniref:transmembrane protein 69-like n=1 Tax=Cololabis saira TaxID=129043 RepID=UPI002AD45F30|nr:transmembrane protein 69-like [Cololabis saira]